MTTSALAVHTPEHSQPVTFTGLPNTYLLAVIKNGALVDHQDQPLTVFKQDRRYKDGQVKPVYLLPNCRLDELKVDTIGKFKQEKIQVAISCLNPEDGTLMRLCLGVGLTTQGAINLAAALSYLAESGRVNDDFDLCFGVGDIPSVTLVSCGIHNPYDPASLRMHHPKTWGHDERVTVMFRDMPRVQKNFGREFADQKAAEEAMLLVLESIRSKFFASKLNDQIPVFADVPVLPQEAGE